ncbi:MAG TPA: dihydroorotase, partial [Pedobacter sp.]
MNLLITDVTIVDPNSQFNQMICDVSIEDGVITAIGRSASKEIPNVINGRGCILSPGFFDLNCSIGDPG